MPAKKRHLDLSMPKAKYLLELVTDDMAETELTEGERATASSIRLALIQVVSDLEAGK